MIFLKSIAAFLTTLSFLVGGVIGANPEPQQPQQFGAVNFSPVQAQKFTLAGAGAALADTSIVLTSFKLPDGSTNITMSNFGATGYATLEPATSKEEQISFTGVTQNVNGTATLTGVSRGLAFVYPYTTVSANRKSHAGGSVLVLSNTAAFYGNEFLFRNSDATTTGIYIMASTSPPRYDSVGLQANGTFNATTSEFASIVYVNKVAAAGCATASAGVKGCVDIATALQAASSSQSGVSGSIRTIPAGIATDTPSAVCNTAPCVVMTALGGRTIKQAFLDFTALWTFTGGLSSTGTTTISASNINTNPLKLNGISYQLTGTQAFASSTVLANNGSGLLSWYQPMHLATTTARLASVVSTTASTTITKFTVPGGTMSTGNALRIEIPVNQWQITAGGKTYFEFAYGAATSSVNISNGGGGGVNTEGTLTVVLTANGATGSQTIDANFVTLSQGLATSPAANTSHTLTTIATDSTANQTFMIVARPSANSSSDEFGVGAINAFYIQ